MRVSIVGLGPGPTEWLTPAARARVHLSGARIFARTRLFPGLAELLTGLSWDSMDDLYKAAASLADVYRLMSDRLLHSGQEVVLLVPGDGVLGESVLDALRRAGAEIDIFPGVSLGAAALAATGTPASEGAQLVDASSLGGSGIDLVELNPRWTAAITGVFNRRVASEVKLALQRVYPPEHAIVVVCHPGQADARIERVPLAELDRVRLEFDHLTHVVVPAMVGFVPTGSAHALRAIVSRLRAPGVGCPWDLEQTHRSLIPYVIEEAYEVVDAIESGDSSGLADELGDLLLQVALHAEIADQSNEFDWNDVVLALSAKLVRRHPHVFGEAAALDRAPPLTEVRGAADVVRNWDQLKAAERVHQPPPASALDGVSRSLPQLRRAAELARRAAKAGFDWPTREGTLDKVREELAELVAATSLAERREELGDLLYILAKLAWQDGLDAEEALRAANAKFAERFAALERIASERGWSSFAARPLSDLDSAWAEAKRRLSSPSPAAEQR